MKKEQKRQYVFLISVLFFSFSIFAQKETNHWYFGNAEGLSFNSPSPIILADGKLHSNEGCASISDVNGNLLFYTDGDTIWNKNHQIMSNGTGLFGNTSTTQAALIIQKPQSSNIFYVFTLMDSGNGLYYSVVDLSLNGGVGEVFVKNVLVQDGMNEKITAVKHCNNRDVWIIATTVLHESPDVVPSNFCAYLLSPYGLCNDPIMSVSPISPNTTVNLIGQLKASPNGKKLAWDGVKYADFNNATGEVSNFNYVPYTSWPTNYVFSPIYGVEFSSDSKLIYNDGFQINIQNGNTSSLLMNQQNIGMQLQLASDGKIYSNIGSIINNPNVLGSGCNTIQNAIPILGATLGLPNFMSSYFHHPKGEFYYDGECINNPISFHLKDNSGIDSVKWIFYDNNSHSKLFNPTHIFNQTGCTKVDVITYSLGLTDTTSQCVMIGSAHSGFLGKDEAICLNDSIRLSINYPVIGKYLWSTGDTTTAIAVKKSGEYWAKVTNSCATFFDTITIVTKKCNPTTAFFASNIITPNGDNLNDVFSIVFSNPEEIQNMKCEIYNRWGTKIYTLTDTGAIWDGETNDGLEIISGVYYWVLSYEDNAGPQNKTGFLQLIR